tara:strand:- start:3017 stop:3703 length:687 start_codon:yes stop_codon:yes gene_type:complete
MNIVKLQWDTIFFGLSIGKLIITNPKEIDLDILKEKAKDFNLIYIFSNYDIEGLCIIDKKEVFIKKDIVNNKYFYYDTVSFSTKIHSYNQLLSLTLQSGKHSRFNIDKNFKADDYIKLYTEWIDKSISKELAIDIIVKIIDNKIVGFTTLNNKTDSLAEIGLVAVDSNYRGLGIARELIQRTIYKAKELNFKSIQVVTQHDNTPAVKLYESTGFRSESIKNIYHYWNI